MDEYDLEEIKREIVEARALAIKTNNLVNALSADLKSIAKRQQSDERRVLTTGAALVTLFVIALFVALKLAWDSRVQAIREETRGGQEKLTALQAEVGEVQDREDQRAKASRQASEFYDLIAQNKRREVVEGYPEVSRLPLTRTEKAVFDAAFERAKGELSLMAYQAGLEHTRTGRWHEAQQSFREALAHQPEASHAPQATFQLARALRELGRQREAIPYLLRLSEASADREVMDDATFLLAECQADIQAWNDARGTLRVFLRRFPSSELAQAARLKLSELQLRH